MGISPFNREARMSVKVAYSVLVHAVLVWFLVDGQQIFVGSFRASVEDVQVAVEMAMPDIDLQSQLWHSVASTLAVSMANILS
jgi:hypothetical protein